MTGPILGIDTSGAVNVGLAAEPIPVTTPGQPVLGAVLAARTVADSRAHAEQLMPLVRDCLADAGRDLRDVGLIVIGMGPGPFTGLRVGIVTAEVLAVALSLPVHRICSLDVLAAQAVRANAGVGQEFLVTTDARRREVYWARYDASGQRLGAPKVSPPTELPRLPAVGPAVDLYPDQLLVAAGPRGLDPGLLAQLGPSLPTVGAEPLYLRRADASEPTRPKSVLVHRPQRSARA